MNQNELKTSTNYIKKLASYPDASERIELYLDSLFATHLQKGSFDVQDEMLSTVSSEIKFTKQEIKKMATTFRKVFIANGLTAHVLKKASGKRTFCYEIRYRANGYDIRAYSTNLQTAKEKFLEKTSPEEIEKYHIEKSASPTTRTTLEEFTKYFFETHRKGKVSEYTYKCDWGRLKKYIFPALGSLGIKQITPDKCQN